MSNVYFNLASGPFQQDWSNTGQVTTDNNWSGVPSIQGFQGQNIVTTTGANAGTALTDSTLPGDLFVLANQLTPSSVFTGGVAEFELPDPTIALQASGVADAPHIVLYLDATGRQNITLSFNARDIDGSGDNTVQQIAVQYRIGATGLWTNLPPSGQPASTPQIADATTGPNAATLVTPVTVVLPGAANNQSQVQVRIITTNAVDNDEWVGIDDITVNSVQSPPVNAVPGPQTVNEDTTLAISGVSVTHPSTTSGFQITLTVANGTLTVPTGGGAFIAGNGSGTVELAGTLAQVNAALAGLQYRGSLNFNGPDTLTIFTDDSSGGTDTDIVNINVGAVNDAPVLDLDADNSSASGADYTATFTAGGAAVSITDVDVSVTEVDATFALSATITLVNRQSGDLLSVNGSLPAGVTASAYNPTTGILTLSSVPGTSLADFEAALHAIQFSSSSANPNSTDRLINVVVNDGLVNSNAATAFIHVVPQDIAPTLDLDANNSSGAIGQNYIATFTQGGAAVAIADTDVAIADVNSTTLVSATITLTNAEATDVLAVNGALPAGITASAYDPVSGTLTLTGAASLAAYQTALQQIEYSSSSASPSTATRRIEVVVNDGTQDSGAARAFIQVIDDPPTLDLDANDSTIVGTDYTATFTENGASSPIVDTDVTILGSTDIVSATITLTNPLAGDLLSVNGALPGGIAASSYNPLTGVLTLTGTAALADYQTALRQIEFSNSSDDPATDDRVIEIVVNDGTGDSNTGSATISVNAVNDIPTLAVAAAAAYTEDGPAATLSPTVTIADPDNANLALAVVTISGAAAGDVLTVNGSTSGQSGNIRFDWLPNAGQLVVTGLASLAEYQALLQSVQYHSTSSDPAGGGPTRTISWTLFNGTTPVTEETTVTVTAVNDQPTGIVGQGGAFSVAELGVGGSANGAVVGIVTAQDPDDNTGFTYSLVDNAGGRFAINSATGQITVAKATLLDFEQNQAHTVIVRAADSGGLSTTENFTINITNVNPENATADADANTIVGGPGNDFFMGLGGSDNLSSLGGDDRLDGGAGNDIMQGGAGRDIYTVDSTSDQVIEQANQGIDLVGSSVTFTLGPNVEDLILTGTGNINGTGNALNNVIRGNAGINVLAGGAGNDAYVVQNPGDQVVEQANQGVDGINASISYTLSANVENLVLSGAGNINGTGNQLANTLTGNAGNNQLRGLGGNDVYVVQNAGDQVIELANQGTDRVNSSVSFTLGANVELLVLNGNAAINGTGNALNNRLTGNSASNTLTGGGGNDAFIFNTALNTATNVDTITDFSVPNDMIHLENAIFTALTAGALATGAFNTGASATQADDRIIYNSATGALIYDSNGSAAGGATRFATLDTGLALTSKDFFVV